MGKSKIAKRRRRRNPAAKAITDLGVNIGAGVAGYAATKLAGRIAFAQSLQRWPNASKHVHVAASALAAAGVYFGSKHWGKIEDYHEAATIGAGIALFQTAVQTYVPQLGWIVSDVNADQYAKGRAQKRVQLPNADLTNLSGLLGDPQAEFVPTPQVHAQQPEQLPPTGDFDLDEFLSEHPDVEAAEVGRAEPVQIPEQAMGGEEDDLSDLVNFNGMMH